MKPAPLAAASAVLATFVLGLFALASTPAPAQGGQSQDPCLKIENEHPDPTKSGVVAKGFPLADNEKAFVKAAADYATTFQLEAGEGEQTLSEKLIAPCEADCICKMDPRLGRNILRKRAMTINGGTEASEDGVTAADGVTEVKTFNRDCILVNPQVFRDVKRIREQDVNSPSGSNPTGPVGKRSDGTMVVGEVHEHEGVWYPEWQLASLAITIAHECVHLDDDMDSPPTPVPGSSGDQWDCLDEVPAYHKEIALWCEIASNAAANSLNRHHACREIKSINEKLCENCCEDPVNCEDCEEQAPDCPAWEETSKDSGLREGGRDSYMLTDPLAREVRIRYSGGLDDDVSIVVDLYAHGLPNFVPRQTVASTFEKFYVTGKNAVSGRTQVVRIDVDAYTGAIRAVTSKLQDPLLTGPRDAQALYGDALLVLDDATRGVYIWREGATAFVEFANIVEFPVLNDARGIAVDHRPRFNGFVLWCFEQDAAGESIFGTLHEGYPIYDINGDGVPDA